MADARFRPLMIGGESGWVDLDFGLIGRPREVQEMWKISVGASHAEREIGFNVVVPTRWEREESQDVPGIGSYVGTIALVAVSSHSDSFIQSLGALYGAKEVPRKMADFTEVNAISLEGNPEQLLTEKVALKIFFGAYPEFGIPYAEAYLNFDVPNGVIQFHEKDPEYRAAILEGLARGTDTAAGQA